ncbi:hypothetical protein Cgig2_009681 [Carnegiea gigantea]|uniref:Uncharacterized protein n=1 Tax=Carnegiea gigantea TaxID=171969 RepID=A0A9Q1QDB9_9CARY|nr:hypothetical protein Cgig2_009681 [Carnegiea gigantea]
MALEQRIDGVDDRIDKLGQKLEALQKGTNDDISELTKKWNARTHVPKRTEHEDIGHKPNGSRDDEYCRDESNGPQPYNRRGRYQDRHYRQHSLRRDQGYPRNQMHDDPYDYLPALPSAVDDVEAILEDEIVSTGIGGFKRSLVHRKGHPQSHKFMRRICVA